MSTRQRINNLLRRLGWKMAKLNTGQIIPPNLPEESLYGETEDTSRLYRPWNDPALEAITPQVMDNTMLSSQKLYLLNKLLSSTLHLQGDIFEAGTCSGGAARLMLNTLIKHHVRKQLWLLDTFQGYQKIDSNKDGAHVQIADCRGKPIEEVSKLLKTSFTKVNLIPGLIPETLNRVTAQAFCFAHIDVNLSEPTLAATQFCLERLVSGGIILFDDYSWPATFGAKRSIDIVTSKWQQEVICIPESTQAFLIKAPTS